MTRAMQPPYRVDGPPGARSVVDATGRTLSEAEIIELLRADGHAHDMLDRFGVPKLSASQSVADRIYWHFTQGATTPARST